MVLKDEQAIDRFLLRVVDGGLAGVIFAAPLLMGGRHAIGQLGLTVFAVAAAWAWVLRQCLRPDARWRPIAVMPLLLIGLALVVLQIVPLPPWLLGRLSPATAEALPLWSAQGGTAVWFGYWNRISFTPAETLAGLVIFLDFVLLFLVTAQRIRRVENVERLLRWCGLSAVVMASFGIVQYLTANGKFFWFYEHPFSDTCHGATGSFTNRNHFAECLALGVGPLIWWLQDAMRQARGRQRKSDMSVGLLGLALGGVLFAGLLSLSRGGTIAMFLAAVICTVVCYRATALGGRFVAALAGAGVLIGLSLAVFGYDSVSDRLEDISSASLKRLDGDGSRTDTRRNIWTNTVKAASHHLLLGTGVGSFGEVYPRYSDKPITNGTEPTHAENGYLQVLLETGIVGLALVLTGMIACAAWCVGGMKASVSTRSRVCAAAIAASLAALAAHSLVDFVWYAPALTAIAAILAACAMRIRQMVGEEERRKAGKGDRHLLCEAPEGPFRQKVPVPLSPKPRIPNSHPISVPRFAWAVAATLLALAGGWMIANRIGPAVAQPYWDEYLVALHAAEAQDSTDPKRALADVVTQERWIACLENVVRWQPTHAGAHLKLVETHRRLFDILQSESPNPMPVLQISDAVFNEPQFQSREALAEWLPRAVGPHCVHLLACLDHVKKALTLCPLEGRGYVHAAELSFLWTSDRAAGRACIQQAMRVRPFDGPVLYAAANQAILTGNESLWREYLRRAFRYGREQQQRIISDRVAAAPPEGLPAVIADLLSEFRLDLENANFLDSICANHCSPEQLAALTRYRVERTEAEAAAADDAENAAQLWLAASDLYQRLQDDARALQCARNALQRASGEYRVHYELGTCLLRQSQFAEAEVHLRWCLQRTPGDPSVECYMREALKGRLDQERRAAKEGEGQVTR
ncbi:MAG: O-antigen ligase family protein [Thermoguttaceae bacterium]